MRKSTIILIAILLVAIIIGVVFTVKWFADHPKYTVTLDANGGSLNSDTVDVRYGREYNLPIPTRKDYDFYGWYLDGVKVDTLGASWDYDSDVTLVAKWKIVDENKFTYTDADGGMSVSDYSGTNLKDIVIPSKFASKKIVSIEGEFELLKEKLAASTLKSITFYVPTECRVGDLSSLGVKYEIVRYDLIEDDYFYIVNEDSCSISGYIGEPEEVIELPKEVINKPVTSIEDGAFNRLTEKLASSDLGLMKMYISYPCTFAASVFDSAKPIIPIVYSVKNGDFYYADKGTHIAIAEYTGDFKSNVVIPKEYEGKPITEIGAYAFYGASEKIDQSSSSFTAVLLPESINAIGKGAFAECKGLKVCLYTTLESGSIREIIDVPTLYKWYTNSEIGENPELLDVVTQIRPAFGWSTYSSVSLYVMLNANGGEVIVNGNAVEYSKFKRNKEYALPTPTKEGYTFEGWYYGETLVPLEGERWLYSTHIELTAKWSQN